MERIVILDFGSQVTQLIARRVREAGVFAEILPFYATNDQIQSLTPSGIILSGGPASVDAEDAPHLKADVWDMGVPILGICYGMQLMSHHLGGAVSGADHREFGRAFIDIKEDNPLFEGLWGKGERHQVWMSHGDAVHNVSDELMVIASTESAPYAAIRHKEKPWYAVQFHPEVVHTPDGDKLLANFVTQVCGCEANWNMGAFLETAIDTIRQKVGDKKVLCAVSGGVDSSVVAALIHRAIGDQLTCIFVDTGCLRASESQQVLDVFRDDFHIPVHHVDASDLFFGRLKDVTDPEKKRKIIGNGFIEVFESEVEKMGGADFLAQGTLYPDVIESVSFHGGPSQTIKSHHNVGGLPEKMKMALLEPVRELFKDEVRALGRELGMSDRMVQRHPFPGPGLAIRIPGEVTPERVEILQKADAIFIEEIRNAGLYDAIWQAFAVLLPVKTVGVMGDARTYESVCALRAVTATDGMTADYFHFDHSFLSSVANRIVNEVRGINRVVYDITSKPPGTIEWE